MLAEMHAEALVLGADEDGADDVPGDEEEEKPVVQFRVVEGVEDAEEDEAGGAGDGEEDAQRAEDFFRGAEVFGEAASVSAVALSGEGEIEEDGGDGAAGDEEGLEALRADVGYIGYVLGGGHAGVVWGAFDFPGDEHGEEHACCAGEAVVSGRFGGALEGVKQVGGGTKPSERADEGEDPE